MMSSFIIKTDFAVHFYLMPIIYVILCLASASFQPICLLICLENSIYIYVCGGLLLGKLVHCVLQDCSFFVLFCFSPESILQIYETNIRPCIEFCCHIWSPASIVALEIRDKIK